MMSNLSSARLPKPGEELFMTLLSLTGQFKQKARKKSVLTGHLSLRVAGA